jgi:hypothetical protein
MAALHHKKNNTERGFIKMIIIIIAALVLLKYVYKVDIIGFLTQGRFKELLDQFYSLASQGWQKYSEIILKIWNFVIDTVKNTLAKAK